MLQTLAEGLRNHQPETVEPRAHSHLPNPSVEGAPHVPSIPITSTADSLEAPGSDRLVTGGHVVAVEHNRAQASASSILRRAQVSQDYKATCRTSCPEQIVKANVGVTSFTSEPCRKEADTPNLTKRGFVLLTSVAKP